MPITRLDDTLINQIAAGEVVERPASVIKELVENALDAGARRIEIATAGGGISFMRVIDDGHGMTAGELELAVGRHCTSKLDGGLNAIATLGFRGEALPSIGSVAELTIRARRHGAGDGAQITVDGGRISGPAPAACNPGTVVEVRHLFSATPARLKFLKSARAENAAISETVKRIALSFPTVEFSISGPDRASLTLAATTQDREGQMARIGQVVGGEFVDNAIAIAAEREGVALTGFAGLPSFHRGAATMQYVYVNGRPVKDRQLLGALRAGYADLMARNRHPAAVLFIAIDPADVDVNVHPAKADVRFRDPGLVKGLMVGAIRQAMAEDGFRASTADSGRLAAAFAPGRPPPAFASGPAVPGWQAPLEMVDPQRASPGESAQSGFSEFAPQARADDFIEPQPIATNQSFPLGAARAQIHRTYIVAQTDDSMVLVDQHAAHERLVYEAFKAAIDGRALPAQMLLVPEIIDMDPDRAARLAEAGEGLSQMGLILEPFGPGAIAVRGTPAMLGETDCAGLIADLSDVLDAASTDKTPAPTTLRERLNAVASSMACHGSVRAGRPMRTEEMNALLRQMESTPGAGTCNHGRPTFIELKVADIERLFGRR